MSALKKVAIVLLWVICVVSCLAVLLIPATVWWWWATNGLDVKIGQAWVVTWLTCWPIAGIAALVVEES